MRNKLTIKKKYVYHLPKLFLNRNLGDLRNYKNKPIRDRLGEILII